MGGRSVNEADRAIAARVKAARIAAGLSQTKLAEALGITAQQVQKNDAGKNRWSVGMLQLAAERIGVPVASFFDEPGESRAPEPLTVARARAAQRAATEALEEAVRREAAALQVAA